MSLLANLQRPMTLVHVAQTGAVDVYGNATETTTTTAVLGYLEQTERGENTDDRQVSAESARLVLAPDTVVDALARVVVDGVTWNVDGPPWPAKRPTTNVTHHVEVRLRRAG